MLSRYGPKSESGSAPERLQLPEWQGLPCSRCATRFGGVKLHPLTIRQAVDRWLRRKVAPSGNYSPLLDWNARRTAISADFWRMERFGPPYGRPSARCRLANQLRRTFGERNVLGLPGPQCSIGQDSWSWEHFRPATGLPVN